jgi:hypothetical protein
MKKSELSRAIQSEIQRHSVSTFMSKGHKIVQTGCPLCERHKQLMAIREQLRNWRERRDSNSRPPA